MSIFGRRFTTDKPRVAGKPWQDISRQLQDWIDKLTDSSDNGLPAGAATTIPDPLAIGSAGVVGDPTQGWAPRGHVHPAPTGIPAPLGGAQAQGISTNAPRLDHVHAVPPTTKGDLWGFDTSGNRVPVGPDGTFLAADSSAALGVSYKTPPGSTFLRLFLFMGS